MTVGGIPLLFFHRFGDENAIVGNVFSFISARAGDDCVARMSERRPRSVSDDLSRVYFVLRDFV